MVMMENLWFSIITGFCWRYLKKENGEAEDELARITQKCLTNRQKLEILNKSMAMIGNNNFHFTEKCGML